MCATETFRVAAVSRWSYCSARSQRRKGSHFWGYERVHSRSSLVGWLGNGTKKKKKKKFCKVEVTLETGIWTFLYRCSCCHIKVRCLVVFDYLLSLIASAAMWQMFLRFPMAQEESKLALQPISSSLMAILSLSKVGSDWLWLEIDTSRILNNDDRGIWILFKLHLFWRKYV